MNSRSGIRTPPNAPNPRSGSASGGSDFVWPLGARVGIRAAPTAQRAEPAVHDEGRGVPGHAFAAVSVVVREAAFVEPGEELGSAVADQQQDAMRIAGAWRTAGEGHVVHAADADHTERSVSAEIRAGAQGELPAALRRRCPVGPEEIADLAGDLPILQHLSY